MLEHLHVHVFVKYLEIVKCEFKVHVYVSISSNPFSVL